MPMGEPPRSCWRLFPTPTRPALRRAGCVRATLRGGGRAIEIPREAARAQIPVSADQTFWDLLMEVVAASGPAYSGYSYRERADRYRREFTSAEAERIRAAASAVRYSTLRDQIREPGGVLATAKGEAAQQAPPERVTDPPLQRTELRRSHRLPRRIAGGSL
jgi:hypothetical protein